MKMDNRVQQIYLHSSVSFLGIRINNKKIPEPLSSLEYVRRARRSCCPAAVADLRQKSVNKRLAEPIIVKVGLLRYMCWGPAAYMGHSPVTENIQVAFLLLLNFFNNILFIYTVKTRLSHTRLTEKTF